MLAHVDVSYKGAQSFLDELRVPESEELRAKARKHRWGIINLWKPLKTITRDPLAVCDASTVPESDLRPVDYIIPANKEHSTERHEVELWYVAHNPKHRWYWPSNMRPDEALLIKCFDSQEQGVARMAPHSAIKLPNQYGPPRESIELRCLVFYNERARL